MYELELYQFGAAQHALRVIRLGELIFGILLTRCFPARFANHQ